MDRGAWWATVRGVAESAVTERSRSLTDSWETEVPLPDLLLLVMRLRGPEKGISALGSERPVFSLSICSSVQRAEAGASGGCEFGLWSQIAWTTFELCGLAHMASLPGASVSSSVKWAYLVASTSSGSCED